MPKKRPVGRPPKKAKERQYNIVFRCSDELRRAIENAAGDKKVSDWIRETLKRAAKRAK